MFGSAHRKCRKQEWSSSGKSKHRSWPTAGVNEPGGVIIIYAYSVTAVCSNAAYILSYRDLLKCSIHTQLQRFAQTQYTYSVTAVCSNTVYILSYRDQLNCRIHITELHANAHVVPSSSSVSTSSAVEVVFSLECELTLMSPGCFVKMSTVVVFSTLQSSLKRCWS